MLADRTWELVIVHHTQVRRDPQSIQGSKRFEHRYHWVVVDKRVGLLGTDDRGGSIRQLDEAKSVDADGGTQRRQGLVLQIRRGAKRLVFFTVRCCGRT
jgi:hypothetical protein